MQFHEHKQFRRSLNDLWRRGGRFQRAANTILAFLGRLGDTEWRSTDPFVGLRLTKWGESRIQQCVKYDLTGYCRLVTVQTGDYCVLLYCGDHEDCDRWIESHRGLEPVVDGKRHAIVTFRSVGEATAQRVIPGEGHFGGKLFERLPEDLYDFLVADIPRSVTRALEDLEVAIDVGDLWRVVALVEDAERRLAVHDVFAMLKDDRVVEAVARIKLLAGDLTPLESLGSANLPTIVDSDVIRRLDPRSPAYAEGLARFMKTARYRDWMTFMHPDQEKVANEDFDGPAKLVGVSGSGKTCVVVRRAIRLAEKYATERVLVVTINRALATLIGELISECAPGALRKRIDVKPLFVLCRDLALGFDPSGDRRYTDVTWKAGEHVDEIWQEYYRCENNNFDAKVFHTVHDSLLARGWSAERYLREEVDWLRSALKPRDRAAYIDIDRKGRTVQVSKAFRQLILVGTAGWEEKMDVVGVTDALGLAQAVARNLGNVRPTYRCALVDEVQDFGNVELEIVRAVVPPGENDLFLCGDAAQAVTSKHQSLAAIGVKIPSSRARRLSQNYRNSRDVLDAAHEVLLQNITPELIDREDFEVLDPEYSTYTAATPLLLSAKGVEDEIKGAFAVAKEKVAETPNAKVCVAVCGYTLVELTRFGKSIGIQTLDGSISLDDGAIFLSDLEQTKGFEFDMVCVINCSAGILPDRAGPEEERFRDLARLYVAMTRAKTDLVVSWSGAESPFFADVGDKMLRAAWTDYVSLGSAPSYGVPERLESYRFEARRKPWRLMTGDEFLFTDDAIGVSVELSSKLRGLVDGVGLKRRHESLKWRSMGDAVDAFQREATVRRHWGPEVGRQLLSLVERLPAAPSSQSTPVSPQPPVTVRRPAELPNGVSSSDPIRERFEAMTWRFAPSDRDACRELERRVASAGKRADLITYSALVQGITFRLSAARGGLRLIDVNAWEDLDRAIVGDFLGYLSFRSYQQAQFLSSALVVGKKDGTPGRGFYELLKELGLILTANSDKAVYLWTDHVQRAYDWYRDRPIR
jgi:hypothetical protein